MTRTALACVLAATACHAPARIVETCWVDRSAASTMFGVRADGDLVVLRGTGAAQDLSRIGVTGRVAWTAPFEAAGDHVEAIALDAHGDVIVVGEAATGCFVMKRSGDDGHALWSTSLSGTGDQYCRAVASDSPTGDVVVTGFFAGTLVAAPGLAPLTSAGSNDVAVLRLSGRDGAVRWARRFGGKNNDISRAVAVDPSGAIAVGGNFGGDGPVADGDVAFGATVLRSAGDFDAFVVELTAAGEPVWARGFGDVGFDLVKSIAPDRDGNLYVSGAWMRAQDFHGGVPFLTGVMDGFVARYSRRGELAWQHIFSGGTSQAHRVVVDRGGAPVIVGHFEDRLELGGRTLVAPPGHARDTAYVAALTPAGAVRWVNLIGEPAAQYGYRLAVSPSGGLVVGGRAAGPGAFCGAPHAGSGDADDYIERTPPR